MAKLGFRVKELMGGLDWWRRDGDETKGKKGAPMGLLQLVRSLSVSLHLVVTRLD